MKSRKWDVLYPTKTRILSNRKVKTHQRTIQITIQSSQSSEKQKRFIMNKRCPLDQLQQNAVLLRKIRYLTISSLISMKRIVKSKGSRDRLRDNYSVMESKCQTIGANVIKEMNDSITLVNLSKGQPLDIFLRQNKLEWSLKVSTQMILTWETCQNLSSSFQKRRES